MHTWTTKVHAFSAYVPIHACLHVSIYMLVCVYRSAHAHVRTHDLTCTVNTAAIHRTPMHIYACMYIYDWLKPHAFLHLITYVFGHACMHIYRYTCIHVCVCDSQVGLAAMDLRTSSLQLSQFRDNQVYTNLMMVLNTYDPTEILMSSTMENSTMLTLIKDEFELTRIQIVQVRAYVRVCMHAYT